MGERVEESAASFLPARDWPPVPFKSTAGWPARIDAGALVAELHRDPWRLSLCDREGAIRMRVPLEGVSLGTRLRELGRQAGFRLLAMIDGVGGSGVVRLPCRLVVRESCGAR
ncbi:MAG TPA: hypothetical protein VN823_05780 [Stellaceae bacterium]|nr:hypothetical protein [Stellaceae bacterium]